MPAAQTATRPAATPTAPASAAAASGSTTVVLAARHRTAAPPLPCLPCAAAAWLAQSPPAVPARPARPRYAPARRRPPCRRPGADAIAAGQECWSDRRAAYGSHRPAFRPRSVHRAGPGQLRPAATWQCRCGQRGNRIPPVQAGWQTGAARDPGGQKGRAKATSCSKEGGQHGAARHHCMGRRSGRLPEYQDPCAHAATLPRTRTPAGQRGHGGQPDTKKNVHSNQRLDNWHGSCIGKGILHET